MKLPRRVPWSNLSELEQICLWIYSDEEDLSSKVLAIHRLSAWKVSTALPHALESVLSLLTVILQDEESSSNSSGYSSALILRQSYSLCLIRLVNGLVDPLQRRAYARSIASIAVHIGLPLWLVELRHASTHEELPSLELLREGSRQAMSWLLHHYFTPTLSPADQSAGSPTALPALSPLLAQYKQLLKLITQDASLKSRSRQNLVRILRDLENWVIEVGIAVSLLSSGAQGKDEEDRERWALERLGDALVDRGGLVPVSKRKRPSPSQKLYPPNTHHIAVWSPLILHMHSRYPTFPSILLSRIMERLLSLQHAEPSTYYQTLASWILWIVDRWGKDPEAECERVDIVKQLLLGLGKSDRRVGRVLVAALAEPDPRLSESVRLLSETIQLSSRNAPWEDDALEKMSFRLSSLGARLTTEVNPAHDEIHNPGGVEMTMEKQGRLQVPEPEGSSVANGWRLLDTESGWRPCPIGVIVGRPVV